ncbi:MAG TPA: DUF4097 family beta strand repeat-containing protein [Thermoanaerobaculia bacterium]|nr:DUF4097 family beta strand repeat-containing protein [Thermoanaerobaculia bacterium]
MKQRALVVAVVFTFSGLAYAQTAKKTFRADQRFPIAQGGTLVLENPVGNIEISGSDGAEIEATTITTITAASAAGIDEGHHHTANLVGGDARTRVLKTVVAATRNGWDSNVDWIVRVPRSTNVTVLSQTSRRIGVTNVAGNVRVKNVTGLVVVNNVTGETIVESVNGSVAYMTQQFGANADLSSINGDITASLPPDAAVQWIAETAKGEIRTNLPARGEFNQTQNIYRGTINGPGGTSITTATLMGNIFLLANGSGMSGMHLIPREQRASQKAPQRGEPVKGFFRYYTNLGDVEVPSIDGDVDVYTGAGKVLLGDVSGACKVLSEGGPLQFGDVTGILQATTRAGDVTVQRARRGGTVTTRGGTIRVSYMNAPMHLASGGGDIVVRRTTAPVKAETTSGDITVTIDKGSATETIAAKTDKGNVIVHIPVNFSADVDATIVTTDPEADTIVSDLPGLTITKEQISGGRTRVRATGRLNRGGEKLTLEAAEGDIRITTAPAALPRN